MRRATPSFGADKSMFFRKYKAKAVWVRCTEKILLENDTQDIRMKRLFLSNWKTGEHRDWYYPFKKNRMWFYCFSTESVFTLSTFFVDDTIRWFSRFTIDFCSFWYDKCKFVVNKNIYKLCRNFISPLPNLQYPTVNIPWRNVDTVHL